MSAEEWRARVMGWALLAHTIGRLLAIRTALDYTHPCTYPARVTSPEAFSASTRALMLATRE